MYLFREPSLTIIHNVCPKSYHSEHIINHIYSMYYKQKLSHVCIRSHVFVYSLSPPPEKRATGWRNVVYLSLS